MSAIGLEVFDTSLQETNHWLKWMMLEFVTDNRRLAPGALRGALHTLRDRIRADKAARLGAQMSMLLRGAYYEDWHPAGTPTQEPHLEDFFDHVAAEVPHDCEADAGERARACFSVMSQCWDRSEMLKLRRVLPHEAINLWPGETWL